MRADAIRALDRWIGRPLCAFLTIGRYLRRIADPPLPPRGPVKKILIIKMIEQGATVLAHPAIRRATELVGRDNVYFWVFEENREILEIMDVIPRANVLTVRTHNIVTMASDLLASLRRIRSLHIDATVDMEFFARAPAIFAFLTGARRRVGLHTFTNEGPYRGNLLTHPVPYNPYLHSSVAYYLLVDALEDDATELPLGKRQPPDIDLSPPRFEPTDAERQLLTQRLNDIAGQTVARPLVLLNPNASDLLPLRRWPTDRYITLAQRILSEHPEVTIGITGAPSEREAAEQLTRAIGAERVVSLAGHTSLRELLVLYTIADILVTNDSGPGHFSSMTNIESICLFGPETPILFGSHGAHHHNIWMGLACSPCVSALNHRLSPCNNNVCMQSISVDDVYQHVHQLLAS